MKKILFILATLFILCGCNINTVEHSTTADNSRFKVVYETFHVSHIDAIYIIIDNETGEKYMFVKKDYGAGLTKLEE